MDLKHLKDKKVLITGHTGFVGYGVACEQNKCLWNFGKTSL